MLVVVIFILTVFAALNFANLLAEISTGNIAGKRYSCHQNLY